MLSAQDQTRAFQALGVTQSAIDAIRGSAFPVAQQLLKQLQDQAHKTYRKLALDLHPDRTDGDLAKEALFKLVSQVHDEFMKLTVRPPQPRPMIRVVYVHVQPFVAANTTTTTTTATVSGTTGSGSAWSQWNNRPTNVNVRPTNTPDPRRVVNMRP